MNNYSRFRSDYAPDTVIQANVAASATQIAAFTYDGDGKQVKSVINGVTTYYVGGYYQRTTNGTTTTETKYYFAGASRVAMRSCTGGTCSAPTYLLGDHLGSTSLITDANGAKISEQKYKPWGETRSGSLPTKYQYTGQRSEMDSLGLYFYNARWYDPALGRFAQADTVIPEQTQGTQAWDRYAGMNNNPVRYNDPTGHCPLCVTALAGAIIGGTVGAIGYAAYTGDFNVGHVAAAFGVGALAGGLIGSVVGAAAGVGVVEAAATGSTAACADGDCTNEANALVKMGEAALESPEAQSLAQKIANTATKNPSSPVVSLGSDGFYQKAGYTFFELPGNAWNVLRDAGTEFVETVNTQFMYTQMNQGKPFGFTINPALEKMGYYSQMEYDILSKSAKYLEIVKDGFDHYFIPK